MAGLHGKSIYTEGDNPWCKTCINSEHITGECLLEGGAYLCLANAIPVKEGCLVYVEETNTQATRRKHS